jgi:hypothetical protein
MVGVTGSIPVAPTIFFNELVPLKSKDWFSGHSRVTMPSFLWRTVTRGNRSMRNESARWSAVTAGSHEIKINQDAERSDR